MNTGLKVLSASFGLIALLSLVFLSAACSGPSPEETTRKAFEVWVGRVGVPYQNATFTVSSSDNFFAKVKVFASFRDNASSPWQEREADVELKKIGDKWQVPENFGFRPTASAVATAQAISRATAVVIEAQRAATVTAQRILLDATATAVAQASATAEVIRIEALAKRQAEIKVTATARAIAWNNALATRVVQDNANATAAAIEWSTVVATVEAEIARNRAPGSERTAIAIRTAVAQVAQGRAHVKATATAEAGLPATATAEAITQLLR